MNVLNVTKRNVLRKMTLLFVCFFAMALHAEDVYKLLPLNNLTGGEKVILSVRGKGGFMYPDGNVVRYGVEGTTLPSGQNSVWWMVERNGSYLRFKNLATGGYLRVDEWKDSNLAGFGPIRGILVHGSGTANVDWELNAISGVSEAFALINSKRGNSNVGPAGANWGNDYYYTINPENPSDNVQFGLTNSTSRNGGTPWVAIVLVPDVPNRFQHQVGHTATSLDKRGLQQVHEFWQEVYLAPNETRRLVTTNHTTFFHYSRWFDYGDESGVNTDNQLTLPELRFDDVDLNNPREEYAKGGTVIFSQKAPGETDYSDFPLYTMQGTQARQVALDQSLYMDYVRGTTMIDGVIYPTLKEPTLSTRIVFDIHPANEMATLMDACKTTGKFLEEYVISAPTGRDLLIGPEHMFNGGHFPNYYYDASAPKNMQDGKWKWNGNNLPTVYSNQFINVREESPGQKTYTLTCEIGNMVYNVAKFTVNYFNANNVGPVQNINNANDVLNALTLLKAQDFDYNVPGTMNVTYYNYPLPSYESSYGFHYHDMQQERKRADKNNVSWGIAKGPYWTEYAFMNRTDNNGDLHFTFPLSNVDGVANGYFLYVDGSQRPGYLFNLNIDADLCPGAKMYISAYVASLNKDLNTTKPNLDFVVEGYDADGNEYHLTTFTTGEFGGAENSAYGSGKWLRVLFPIEIDDAHDYVRYSLRIVNKGKNSAGNDFAIDNIAVYASKPTLMAQQGVVTDCYEPTGAEIWTFLRVDYGSMAGLELCYQWRLGGNVLDAGYYNKVLDADNGNHGKLALPSGNPNIDDVYASFVAFNNAVNAEQNDEESMIGYVLEKGDDGMEEYVLYIATKCYLKPGEIYTCYIANSPTDFDNGACGMQADLQIVGTTYISINGEKYDAGIHPYEELCGNRRYDLQVMLQTNQNGTQNDISCKAAWLWGDEEWVNLPENQSSYYNASYVEICDAIRMYLDDPINMPQDKLDLVNHLISDQLLYLDRDPLDAYMLADKADRLLRYTAFPYKAEQGKPYVCLNPLTAKILLKEVNNEVVRVGYPNEELPNLVSVRPRIVRVSKAAHDRDSIKIPIVYKGTASEIHLAPIQTEDGNVTLTATPSVITSQTTSITLEGISQLEVAKGHMFALRPEGYDVNDCSLGESYFVLRIVPERVTWARSREGVWNKEGTWSPQFAPTPETDVILPAYNDGTGQMNDFTIPLPQVNAIKQTMPLEEGARTYISYDIYYEPYACRNIYVPDSTVILNQHLLQVNGQAYVDMTVPTNTWTLASMPITGVVSGDFWIPAGGNSLDPFTVPGISQVTGETATDRTAHEVWQSIYNGEAIQYGDYNREVTSSNWSAPTNALNTSYGAGYGFALWAKSGDAQTTFRFPKPDKEYKFYYDYSGKWTDNQKVSVNRTGAGKFVYTKATTTIKLTNNTASEYFLFGNPTMAYVDLTKLKEGNGDKLTGSFVLLTPGETTNMEVSQALGELSTGVEINFLPPFSSVLVQTNNAAQQLDLVVDSSMLLAQSPVEPLRMRSSEEPSLMRITAQTPNYVSRAVVAENPDASDWVLEGEDAELFLLDEYKTPFGIFTLADDKTLAINQINGALDIPLCLYVQSAEAVGNIKLTFTGSDSFLEQWSLYDVMTEQEVPLFNGCSYVLEMPNNGGVRYLLRRPSSDDGSSQPTDAFRVWSVGGDLTVYAGAGISNFRLTDMAGRLLHEERDYCQSVQLHLIPGVYLVYGEIAGKSYTQRVIVK